MTALKWEEGKMYQLRIDMADEFRTSNGINESIFNLIGYKTFMVEKVDWTGRVTKLVGYSNDTLSIDYWLYPHEIKYFDLVEDTEGEQEMTSTKTEQEIVEEWLEKLRYVMYNGDSVSEILYIYAGGLMLSTDLCDIYGATGIYDFITNQHTEMKSQVETKRKKELLDKRAELELQLAQINKELGE